MTRIEHHAAIFATIGLPIATLALSACSLNSSAPPAGIASDCLAMPAGDGQGWSDLDVPVADMLTPFQKPDAHQSWERQPDGYIYRAERADPITGKVGRFAIQLVAAGSRKTTACGPARYGVSRINADGTDLMGWDLINFVPGLIAPATQMREAQAAGPAKPPPPVGAPVGPITPPPLGPITTIPDSTPTASRTAATTPTAPGAPATSAKLEDALYSQTYRTCMSTGEAADGVTSGILDCVGAETGRQDAQLNQVYHRAAMRLPLDRVQALRLSERAWIKSRDAGCRASMGDEAGGTMGAVLYAQCVLEEEAKRVRYVEAFQ